MDTKAKEIIGLPIITYDKGTKIGQVEDMILDPERRQVLALVIQEKMWMHSARAIPFGRTSAIGPDAVIVANGKAIVDVNRDTTLKQLYNSQMISGLRVITTDGRKLGVISDMLLDTQTGEIKGYYVSIGRVLNMGQGMRWLPAEKVQQIGQRVAYVSPEVAADFETQTGGWSGALDQAGEKLRVAGGNTNTRLEDWGEKAKVSGAKLNSQLETWGDQMRDTVPQRTKSMLVGKAAHTTVTDAEGTLIVKEGEIITTEQVDAAQNANRLPQLLLSAGLGPARQHTATLGTQASENFTDMKTEARQLWEQLTGGYTRSVDQADDKLIQKRIKNALGRPASRVILDTDDNVILNTGDIITNRAVQTARDAGVLDILVESVYVEKPKLDLSELKAPHSGEASLENQEISNGSGKTLVQRGRARSNSTTT